MRKLTNKRKRWTSKNHAGNSLRSGVDVLQDSLSLIRRRKNPCEGHIDQVRSKIRPTSSLPKHKPSKGEQTSGMSTHCLISDGGLDGDTSHINDTDSSIEMVRDAGCGSPAFLDVLNIPSIVINKAQEDVSVSHLENPKHLNIKHSTMNQSDMEAQMTEMENLSPIRKSDKKGTKISLINASIIPFDDEPCDASSSSKYQKTGKTPHHVRKIMNKLRALGTKHSEKLLLDVNHNSVHHSQQAQEDSSDIYDSDEWSPSNVRKSHLANKWIEDQESEMPKRTYLHCKILPEWKKCIRKPPTGGGDKSIRTSSPSPHASFARKSASLQISSIHECASDVSVDLNFESCPKYTVNSDEIAPFSTIGFEPSQENPELIDHEQNSASDQTPGRERETDDGKRDKGEHVSRVQEANSVPEGNSSRDNVSIMADESCYMPSPEVIIAYTGIRAPDSLGIPTDELCSSDFDGGCPGSPF